MRPLILVAMLVAGCSSDSGPSCAQLTDHLHKLTREAYPGHGDMQLSNKKADIAECERKELSASQRKCILAATTLAELGTCMPAAPAPTQKPGAPPAAPATP